MVSLRRLTLADAATLSDMGGRSLLESHGHSAPAETMQAYVDSSFSIEACRNELADEANIFTGIFYGEELAGYSKIIINVPHPAVPLTPVTKMERLYLLQSFYRLKLGHQLMEEATRFSKSCNEKGMWLNVWKKNERALHFYERQGFVAVGESEFVLTETHSNPNWVMLLAYSDL